MSHSVPMLVAGMSPLHVYSAMVEGSGAIARAGGGAAAAGLLSLPSARGGLEPFSALEMGRVALLLAGTCFIATQSESAPSGRRIVEAYEKQGMHLRGGWSSGRAARHVESYVGRLRVINLLTIWALWASRYAASSAALDPISVLLCLELAVARLPGFYKRLWSRRR